jgi:hypothetical protein
MELSHHYLPQKGVCNQELAVLFAAPTAALGFYTFIASKVKVETKFKKAIYTLECSLCFLYMP